MTLRLGREMAGRNTIAPGLDFRVAAGSLLVLFGLALPFLPVPGDRITRIAVEFRTADMAQPASFSARTKSSICRTLAAAMAYEDPASGGFTRIDCGHRTTSDAARAAKEVVGAGGIEPPTPTMSR